MTDEEAKKLAIGRKYLVELEDCCIAGEFEATLVDLVYYEWPEDLLRFIDFGNGVRLSTWNGVSIS